MVVHPLKYERELRGWSQAKVAEEVGTTVRTVSRWEHGLALPYPYFREQLCALFGKNAVELGLVAENEQEPSEETRASTSSSPLTEAQTAHIYDSTIPVALGESGLVGRDALLMQLKELLCTSDNSALIAINGLPGIGKTALAVALATDPEVQAYFCDGILWVGLGTQPNVSSLLAHWGMLLGVPARSLEDGSSWEAWGKVLHEAFGTRRMLLIIDDAWKIEDALAFQIGGPNCAHLLTSRIPQVAFAFARERVIEVSQLNDADGLALMARFVPEIVALEAANARTLVRSVGALPLALTLMSKYLAAQAFTKQTRRLHTAITQLHDAEQRLRLSIPIPITARSPGLPADTPLSLHAAIAVSDQQISKEAHRALAALSILPAKPNSFSEEMALAVAEVAVEVLDELSDAGLLESSGPNRYTLHQTISDYAKLQSQESTATERFVKYCIAYVQAHQTDYKLLDPEISNILAAFDIAYQIGRYTELLQGIYAFVRFLQIRGLHSLIAERLLQAYTVAKSLKSSDDIITIACLLGEITQVLGANIQAEDYLQEGLVLARQLGKQTQICRLLAGLSERAAWQGDFVKAEAYCREGLAIARQLVSVPSSGSRKDMCSCRPPARVVSLRNPKRSSGNALGRDEQTVVHLTVLAWVVYEQRDYARAETIAQEALHLARQINYQEYISRLLAALGGVATVMGNLAQAEAYYQEGLAIAQTLQQKLIGSLLLAGQGWLAGKLKNYAQAEAYTRQSLFLTRQMGFHELTYLLLSSLGWLAEKREAFTEAGAYYEEALLLGRQHKKPQNLCMILFHMGKLHLKQQQFEVAATIFHEMLSLIPLGRQDLVERAQSGLASIAAITQNSQADLLRNVPEPDVVPSLPDTF